MSDWTTHHLSSDLEAFLARLARFAGAAAVVAAGYSPEAAVTVVEKMWERSK